MKAYKVVETYPSGVVYEYKLFRLKYNAIKRAVDDLHIWGQTTKVEKVEVSFWRWLWL